MCQCRESKTPQRKWHSSTKLALQCHPIETVLKNAIWELNYYTDESDPSKCQPKTTRALLTLCVRAIFVWPWNENARTRQKQQTNENRVIWLVCRTDTNARSFWLVKQTLGWKNFMPKNFLEINRYLALTSYCDTIDQSNNVFSIFGFSLAGKWRVHVLIFSSIGW